MRGFFSIGEMYRTNPFVFVFFWIIIPSFLIFSFAFPAHANDCDSCVRKIQVKTYTNFDIDFDTSIFLQHFGSYFRSPCIQLGENLTHPEYILTVTLSKDDTGKMLSLGITLGFTGGKIGQRDEIFDHISQTYQYYFGHLVAIHGVVCVSDSLEDVIEAMKKETFDPIDQIIRCYEQTPVSAEVDHNLECEIQSRKNYVIDFMKFESGYPRIDMHGPKVRIVVHAERGKITNGVALEDDNNYKVLDFRSPLEKRFNYEPPEGEDKSDTIIIYNACDILHEEVLPLSKTKKYNEIARVEMKCIWEGTIASSGKIASQGDESLLTAMMPKSKYQSITNWKLDVEFKLDRGNERIKVYDLKSARFSFLSEFDADVVMQDEIGKMQMTGKDQAKVSGRILSPSDCNLELIIDLKKKTYKIEGILHVKNITEKVEGEFELDMPPIHGGEKDSGDQMIEYREEILIEGKFSEDSPKKLGGSIDEIKELPPEFVEFTEALAGKASGKIRWKLEWKGNN